MAPSETKPPPKNALTWLIFCALGLGAMIGGLLLPGAFARRAWEREGIQEPTAAVPAPQPVSPLPTPKLEGGGAGALEYEPPALPDMAPAGPMLLRLTLGTIFVLILCTVTLWAGKRWVRPLAAPAGQNRKLRVLESLPLGGRCSVILLQAGEASVLVGVDQTGIKTLLPLPQSFDSALAELAVPTQSVGTREWGEGRHD